MHVVRLLRTNPLFSSASWRASNAARSSSCLLWCWIGLNLVGNKKYNENMKEKKRKEKAHRPFVFQDKKMIFLTSAAITISDVFLTLFLLVLSVPFEFLFLIDRGTKQAPWWGEMTKARVAQANPNCITASRCVPDFVDSVQLENVSSCKEDEWGETMKKRQLLEITRENRGGSVWGTQKRGKKEANFW